jgi:ABC-type phosphate transport system substrate-binding protein
MAVAVLGRTLTKAEQESFDPESLVNKQVKVMVEQKPSKDGTKVFNNILSFSHADKEMEKVEFEAKPAVVEKTSVGIAIDNQEIDPEAEIKKLEEEKAKK